MKIKVQVPLDICNVSDAIFKEKPEDIILGLKDIITNCKTAGYSDLSISWSVSGDCPFIYGMRNETTQEKVVRLKKEAAQEARAKERKKKEVEKAIQIIQKYKNGE